MLRLFHLLGLGLAFLIQVLDWYCPLTHLEVYFRSNKTRPWPIADLS